MKDPTYPSVTHAIQILLNHNVTPLHPKAYAAMFRHLDHALFIASRGKAILYRNEAIAMAKSGFRDWQFVTYSLPAASEKDFDNWVDKQEGDKWDAVREMGEEGYKLTFVLSDENNSWIMTAVWTKKCKHNENRSLSSYSDDMLEAALLTAYKHYVTAKGGDWDALVTKTRRG